jgi:hypothetical protein
VKPVECGTARRRYAVFLQEHAAGVGYLLMREENKNDIKETPSRFYKKIKNQK